MEANKSDSCPRLWYESLAQIQTVSILLLITDVALLIQSAAILRLFVFTACSPLPSGKSHPFPDRKKYFVVLGFLMSTSQGSEKAKRFPACLFVFPSCFTFNVFYAEKNQHFSPFALSYFTLQKGRGKVPEGKG